MRRAIALAGLVLAAASPAVQADSRIADARAWTGQLEKQLGGRLKAAMTEGGPVAAIETCRTAAPDIAERLSTEHGTRIGRTALRVRNPANAPDPGERAVLEMFRDRIASGEAIVVESIERGGGGLRYMRSIPTKGVCLACHGDRIAPDVRAAIDTAYPDDKATGFALGDLRGAFVVEWTHKAETAR